MVIPQKESIHYIFKSYLVLNFTNAEYYDGFLCFSSGTLLKSVPHSTSCCSIPLQTVTVMLWQWQ